MAEALILPVPAATGRSAGTSRSAPSKRAAILRSTTRSPPVCGDIGPAKVHRGRNRVSVLTLLASLAAATVLVLREVYSGSRLPVRLFGDLGARRRASEAAASLEFRADGPKISGQVDGFEVQGEFGDSGATLVVVTGLDWTFGSSGGWYRQYSGDPSFDKQVAFLPARRPLAPATRELLVWAVRDGLEHLGSGHLEAHKVPDDRIMNTVQRMVALAEALREDRTTQRDAAESDPNPDVRRVALRWAVADGAADDAWLQERQKDPDPRVAAEAAGQRHDVDWLLEATQGQRLTESLHQLARLSAGPDPRLDRVLIAAFRRSGVQPPEWLELAGRSASVGVVPALLATSLPRDRVLPVVRRIQARSSGERGALATADELGTGGLSEAGQQAGGLSAPTSTEETGEAVTNLQAAASARIPPTRDRQ